ncbi:MAG: hypothetical protein Q9160_009088 [Pyrenula sp. 1 TL-2023]
MPLRQTTLHFTLPSAPLTSSNQAPVLSRASTASSDTLPGFQHDADTIVVARPGATQQLPTPSESSAEVALERSLLEVHKSPRHRGALDEPDFQGHHKQQTKDEDLIDEACGKNTSRTVSGETLVPNAHPSQSSLLRDGISALDIPWSVSSSLREGSQKDDTTPRLDKFPSLESLVPEPSTLSSRRAVADEQTRAERIAKIKQSAADRLAKIQDAESRATRRSSRVSVIEKAGDAISDLTATVLGKRTQEAIEKGKDALEELKRRASLRSRGTDSHTISGKTSNVEEPPAKKRRLEEQEEEESNLPKPKPRKPKHKRFLNAGLYTGQSRHFDGRLTTSKNKRKALQQDHPPEKENPILPLPMFAGERLLNAGRDFRLPFSIFSPLPAGQPKPDEWRKVNKNVFVGDAGSIWRTSKFMEHSTCMCTPETGCVEDCQNRFMFYECDDRNCNLGSDRCGNRSFAGLKERVKRGGKFNIGVEVIKTADRGYGVRSNRCFEPNQIIVEYTGEIITQEECEGRMRERYKDNECYYLMLFDQNMIIDATRGSIARFVNHSCQPNCRMEKWTVEGKPRMALFAGDAGIETGEELTYDYNFDPFSQKNVQECRCGSERCRGVLGPRPKEERKSKAGKGEEKEKEKEKEASGSTNKGILAGAKRRIAQVLEEGSNLVNKRKKISATNDAPPQRAKPSKASAQRTSLSRKESSSITVAEVERKTASTGKVRSMLKGANKAVTSSIKSNKAANRPFSDDQANQTEPLASLTEDTNDQKTSSSHIHRQGSVRARAATVTKRVVKTVTKPAPKASMATRKSSRVSGARDLPKRDSGAFDHDMNDDMELQTGDIQLGEEIV